jgi:hypothetical protein
MLRRVGTRIAGQAEPGGEDQQVLDHRQVLRHAAADRQVGEREADHAEQQGQRRRDGVAEDDLDVPQLVAQDGVGEGQRHQAERHHRHRDHHLREIDAGEPRQQVERQERQVAAGEADGDPAQLPGRLAPPSGAAAGAHQPPPQHRHRGEREEAEVEELDGVQAGQRAAHVAAGQPAAAEGDQVDLRDEQEGRRQVEERQPAADRRAIGDGKTRNRCSVSGGSSRRATMSPR